MREKERFVVDTPDDDDDDDEAKVIALHCGSVTTQL